MRHAEATLPLLAPEFQLLCRAVRRALDPSHSMEAAETSLDWDLVVQGARSHRVVPLVLAGLSPHGPSEILAKLSRIAAADARTCLSQAAEVVRLSRLFADAGIRMMVFKGVVLSQQLYGDPARRGPGDIDILVDPERLWDADGVLIRAGYVKSGRPIPPAHRRAGQRLLRDITYRGRGAVIELHQRLTANPARFATRFDQLWQDRREVPLGGAMVPTLPDAVLPLYLCVHGAHHCWERLCWLADVARLLRDGQAGPSLSAAQAVELGKPMQVALALGREWLGLDAPLGENDRTAARRFVTDFLAGPNWIAPPKRGSTAWLGREWRRRIYLYSLKPSWRHLLQELRADLLNPIDWDVLPLPERLLWLYPLIRPVGWLVRNLRRERTNRGDRLP